MTRNLRVQTILLYYYRINRSYENGKVWFHSNLFIMLYNMLIVPSYESFVLTKNIYIYTKGDQTENFDY